MIPEGFSRQHPAIGFALSITRRFGYHESDPCEPLV
jgi:hypothetical protein